MRRTGFLSFQILTAAVALLLLDPQAGRAHDVSDDRRGSLAPAPAPGASVETPRFTLYFPSAEQGAGIPLDQLAKSTLSVLDDTYEELSAQFQIKPQQKVIFRFLTPEEFRKHTGAPAWTSAMYLRGEVSIPVSKSKRPNPTELRRAIRHEYTHAVVAELSGRRCPAWLDEGLAQMMEGDVNPLLGPALRRWTQDNSEAMPLSWLQNGFMTLSENIVPAAYAESLFAARSLVKKLGYSAVLGYLSALREGVAEPQAFRQAFGISERQFERQLTKEMNAWAQSGVMNP